MIILQIRHSNFKPVNESFNKLQSKATSLIFKTLDLTTFGSKLDVLSYQVVVEILDKAKPFDAILVGDVFWPTGQHICKYGAVRKNKVFFLQHGQWIYDANKRNPPFVPFATFLFGDDVYEKFWKFPYGSRSKLFVTGSPRYDNLKIDATSDMVYFSPPVVLETSPSSPPKKQVWGYNVLSKLQGLDQECNLLIHPHYREGDVGFLKDLFPLAKFADPQENALALIGQSRMVLTHRNSTCVIDAISLRRPCALIDLEDMDWMRFSEQFVGWSYFPRNYFCEFAKESSDASECFNNVKETGTYPTLNEQDYIKKAKKYICLGEASKRIETIMGRV